MKFLTRRKPQQASATASVQRDVVGAGVGLDETPDILKPFPPTAAAATATISKPSPPVRGLRRGGLAGSFRRSKRNLTAPSSSEEAEDIGGEEYEQYEQHAPSKAKPGALRRRSRLSDIRSSVCSILSNADTVLAANIVDGGDGDGIGSDHSRRSLMTRGPSFKKQPSFKKRSSMAKQQSFKRSIRFEQPVFQPDPEPEVHTKPRPNIPARWAMRRQSTDHTLSTLGTASTRSTLSSMTGGSSIRSVHTAEHA
eukprot:CAMPEP_0197443396 /NCGR_PEP_ID=MMETSP1175-20131217/9141_1 /TAXON_ID=1003142 /ORGANISM="Triceratium dubium, Strain CCMP147" /LENGTH=252 /DNA_ID=CAMNT_0042974013 /DNA_START=75 /DNA_END=829 /DNA_ORIENTATION=+